MQKTVLIVIGTRPEAIKMAPVYKALSEETAFSTKTLCSGQHDELIHQVFQAFDWQPDYSLTLMRKSHDPSELYTLLFNQLDEAFRQLKPDVVIVHGDTATTAVASFVAFLQRIPCAHVEAGLRSYNKHEPWPEEINRKITDLVADIYFAPTPLARDNLLQEGVNPRNIIVTGNTVVDALLHMSQKLETDEQLSRHMEEKFGFLDNNKKLVLLTGHRRENFGKNLNNVFAALKRIALETDTQIIFPAHPNQRIQEELDRSFLHSGHMHVMLPLNYPSFVYLMKRCDLIISDSGGIQEEAPTFGKKVLVTRNVTERPEGLASGFLEIVGCDEEKIVERAKAILTDTNVIHAANPYGDGKAAERIRDTLLAKLASTDMPVIENKAPQTIKEVPLVAAG